MFLEHRVNGGRGTPVAAYVNRGRRLQQPDQTREPRLEPPAIVVRRSLLESGGPKALRQVVRRVDEQEIDEARWKPLYDLEEILIDRLVLDSIDSGRAREVYQSVQVWMRLFVRKLDGSVPRGDGIHRVNCE